MRVECIQDSNGYTLAFTMVGSASGYGTSFVTPDLAQLQVGVIQRPAGHVIPAHTHRIAERVVQRTAEVLVVRRGAMRATFYDDAGVQVAVRELRTGDVVVLLAGGHGFHVTEDVELLEVKQGPYLGTDDKRML